MGSLAGGVAEVPQYLADIDWFFDFVNELRPKLDELCG
jgi:hypothetical protein